MRANPPSEREVELLKVLWKLGEASVRQVLDELAPKGELAFNTIQTQLRIMEDKGLVRHRAVGRTFIYRPVYSREEASSRFLNKVFDGAVRDLVMTLLRSRKFDPAELDDLQRLIGQARQRLGLKKGKDSL
jgi:predicted transcriptional regulator